MSRTLSTEMQAVATAEVVRPIYLLDLEFSSGSVYFWSGYGDLNYNSNSYLGAGDLLNIAPVKETADLTANGMIITLAGIKQSLLLLARDEPYQGRPLTIRLGAFDESGDLIASPVILFSGFMDVMTIEDNGETSTIQVSAENKLIAFQRTAVRRYTAEDQKIEHPTDKGFEFVAKIQEKEIIWGRPTPASMASNGNNRQRGR
jgi:hypothetical protein|tara:strand:- start:5428 stop:6036 length:609 start_codon:yes stop_codon:yes gene_type:complete